MKCNKCGNMNPDKAVFCRYCGNRLQEAAGPARANTDINPGSNSGGAYGSTPNANSSAYGSTPNAGSNDVYGAYGSAPNAGSGGAYGAYGSNPNAGSGTYGAYGSNPNAGSGGAYGAYGSNPNAGSGGAYGAYGSNPNANSGGAYGAYGSAPNADSGSTYGAQDPYKRGYTGPAPSRTSASAFSKWLIIVIAEAAAAMVILLIAVNVFKHAGTVDKKAEKYFVSIVNGNYSKAFSELNLKKDKFINPDGLELAYADMDYSEVDNYTIQDYTSVETMYGLTGDTGELGRSYVVYYRNKGATYNNQFDIHMVKSGKGGKWYVSSGNIISKDVTIRVPRGASVTVDGVELTEKYATDESGDSYGTESTVYTIPQIFSGTHYVSVTAEGRQDLKTSCTVYGERDSLEFMDMLYTKETLQTLQTQAMSNMQRVYQAALNSDSFDTIAELFTANSERLEQIRSEYEGLVENLHSENDWVTSMTIKDVEASSDTGSPDVYISFNCTGDHHEKSYDGTVYDETSDVSTDSNFDFGQENGSWVQTNFDYSYMYF